MLNMDFACPKKGNRKLDATTVYEINPKRDPHMDTPKRTPNTWLWGTQS